MDCFRATPITFLPKKYFSFLLYFCGSLPVFAASESQSFSFIEFIIAFVLGLGLPVLLASITLRKLVVSPWGYFAGILLSVLGFLYSVAQPSSYQVPIALSNALICITLIYLWLLSLSKSQDQENNQPFGEHFTLGQRTLAVAAFVYLITIWLFPSLDAYLGWVMFSGFVLFVGAAHIAISARVAPQQVIRLVVQWLAMSVFVGAMYLWLNTQLALKWVIVSYLASFIVSIINGNWLLMSHIYQALNRKNKHDDSQLSPEQLFSYGHDPATNLPTYQQAVMRYEQVLKQAQGKRYAIIVIKPKNFNHVNQVLGHQNSDILLLQLAYCLQREVADNQDLVSFEFTDQATKVARLPSLHFLVVMDVTDRQHNDRDLINQLCQQLASAVPQAMSFKSFSLNFELACGVAYSDRDGVNIAELIAHAGDAVIEAENNHQLWCAFDQSRSAYTEQQLLKMERLKQDLDDDLMQFLLEPIINLDNHQIRGFTLQMKWRYAGKELLAMDEFLPIAEQSGDIYRITKVLIAQAFSSLVQLNKLGIYQPLTIALSSKEMLEPYLAEYIEQQAKIHGISTKYLMIEFTEPVMVLACDRAKNLIDQLKSLDIGISIGDFSGSYESLRYIRKLSVNQIKIRCDLLSSENTDRAEKAIVNSLINLARTMKLPFVGSDINNSDIKTIYQTMGGQVAQGKLFSAGIVSEGLEDWVANYFKSHPSADVKSSSLDI